MGNSTKIWVLVMLFSLLIACGKEEAKVAPPAPEVAVVDVIQKDVPIFSEWVATTEGLVNATILAQVQGILIKQNYKEGDVVKKDTLLFEIDPRPFQDVTDQAKSTLAREQAVLNTAQANLKRIIPLAAANAVSQKDKDDATGRVQAAEAQVQSARATVRKAEFDLNSTKIVSPIDGIAGAAKAQIGDLVGTPQAQVLTTVSTVDPIKVFVSISEREYFEAMEWRKKKAETGSTEQTAFDLILADGSTWPHPGEFSFADRQVSAQTGTLQVAILFPNPGPPYVLRPGLYAKVRARTSTQIGALLVPQRSVGELQGNYQVAVVDDQNTVHIRNVKVGERTGELWVITEGLSAGEKVVAEGIQKAADGTKVTPKAFESKP